MFEEGRFIALLKCSVCGEVATVAGLTGNEPFADQEGDLHYTEYLYPRWISPAPIMIAVPRGCPADVVANLRSAFTLYLERPQRCRESDPRIG